MTKEMKIILGGAAVCFAGSVLVYFDIAYPGYTAMVLGGFGVIAGPMAVDLGDSKP